MALQHCIALLQYDTALLQYYIALVQYYMKGCMNTTLQCPSFRVSQGTPWGIVQMVIYLLGNVDRKVTVIPSSSQSHFCPLGPSLGGGVFSRRPVEVDTESCPPVCTWVLR